MYPFSVKKKKENSGYGATGSQNYSQTEVIISHSTPEAYAIGTVDTSAILFPHAMPGKNRLLKFFEC